MEFGVFIMGYTPQFRRDVDPDAEHHALMDELDLVQAADRAGFKYVWVTEHHFLDEYSHLSANDVVLGYLAHATEQIHIGWRNVAASQKRIFNKSLPQLPVVSTRFVHHHNGEDVRLAGLDKRERFECFVVRAKSAREQHDGIRLLDKHELASEEVSHRDQFRIALHNRVGGLLEWQENIQAKTVVAASPAVTGFHDTATSAGNHHPARFNHSVSEFLRSDVTWMVGSGSCRTEHRGLAPSAVTCEHLEAIPEFANRGGHELDIAAAGVIAKQLVGCLLDLGCVFFLPKRSAEPPVSELDWFGVGDGVEWGAWERIGWHMGTRRPMNCTR